MHNRTVAIVGRPNVGKSALFNRIIGRKVAIVHDQPGVTRDRLAGESRIGSTPFTVLDTGGIGSDVDTSFTEQVRVEADIALASAQLVLFVVDGRDGINPVDADLAKMLRRVDKPLILVVNKIDTPRHELLAAEFARLGFEKVAAVSAEHGHGILDLVEQIEAGLPAYEAPEERAEKPAVHIAILGRPNVGKSSLINAILNDRRTIVSEIAGTTRDAVDIPYERGGERFVLIDTAGIRARNKVRASVEVFSVMRSEKSVERADLCVLVVDAEMGVTAMDRKIAGLIQEANKPCIIVMNKWDLIKPEAGGRKEALRKAMEDIRANLFFLDYAPAILASAKTGEEIGKVFRAVSNVRKGAEGRIGTGPLNRVLQEMQSATPPPRREGGKRFKIVYGTQVEPTAPSVIPLPEFLFFVNDPKVLTKPYRKYIESQLRAQVPFDGLPLKFHMRGREKRGGESREKRKR